MGPSRSSREHRRACVSRARYYRAYTARLLLGRRACHDAVRDHPRRGPRARRDGLACRLGEGVLGAASLPEMERLLWLATTGAGAGVPDVATASALGAFLLMPGTPIGATFFAVGSTIFSYLLLRGRLVPVPLAWLGVLASVLLVVGLPCSSPVSSKDR